MAHYHLVLEADGRRVEIDGDKPPKMSTYDFLRKLAGEIGYFEKTGRIQPGQETLQGITLDGELHLDIMEPTS